jgi:hypothetical protein
MSASLPLDSSRSSLPRRANGARRYARATDLPIRTTAIIGMSTPAASVEFDGLWLPGGIGFAVCTEVRFEARVALGEWGSGWRDQAGRPELFRGCSSDPRPGSCPKQVPGCGTNRLTASRRRLRFKHQPANAGLTPVARRSTRKLCRTRFLRGTLRESGDEVRSHLRRTSNAAHRCR